MGHGPFLLPGGSVSVQPHTGSGVRGYQGRIRTTVKVYGCFRAQGFHQMSQFILGHPVAACGLTSVNHDKNTICTFTRPMRFGARDPLSEIKAF